MAQDVEMDYQLVNNFCKVSEDAENFIYKAVDVLEAITTLFQNSAFLGTAGQEICKTAQANRQYLIDDFLGKVASIREDVQAAMKAIQEGDTTAKGRFN